MTGIEAGVQGKERIVLCALGLLSRSEKLKRCEGRRDARRKGDVQANAMDL